MTTFGYRTRTRIGIWNIRSLLKSSCLSQVCRAEGLQLRSWDLNLRSHLRWRMAIYNREMGWIERPLPIRTPTTDAARSPTEAAESVEGRRTNSRPHSPPGTNLTI
ncbi:uncharacterized protein LOC112552565 [Pogonomyrmex barbatus]|uniref:Uncharacterized protein LOC112552565 n=1 Tax=Pogonomyrmex barbatus TaxID=144034 RepID=A0A8N1S7B3_9HYME|nr:uncharacterized protein LOC112552565 [Pogonomyrmex barbatus]